MYINYEEYKQLGGNVESTSLFEELEKKAEYKLNYWTQNRLKAIVEAELSEDVKYCMKLLIDALAEVQNGQGDIATFSHDGISVSYAEAKTTEKKMSDVYKEIVEVLPIKLVRLGVDVNEKNTSNI